MPQCAVIGCPGHTGQTFLCLPYKALDNLALKRELDDIGKSVSPVAQDR